MSEKDTVTDNVEATVSSTPKKRFDWGVATAVAAVVLLLTGIGFASEQVRNSTSNGSSAVATDDVTKNFITAVTSSAQTALLGGIVENYSRDGREVGKIIYNPTVDKDLIVVYVGQTEEYFIDLPNNGLTILAISSENSVASLKDFTLTYDGKGKYTIQPKEGDKNVCSGITVSEGFVTEVANISCKEGTILPNSIVTNFSYTLTEEDKAMFNEGMATGQSADDMQQQQPQQ